MNSSVAYIVGIIVTISGGAYLQHSLCCGSELLDQNLEAEAGMPFHIQFTDGEFEYQSAANFDFLFSSYTYLTPLDREVELGIEELNGFLSDHPEVFLTITGYGYPTEDNFSAFPTLGEARANSVKSALIERGVSENQLRVQGKVIQDYWADRDTVVRGPLMFALSPSKEPDSLESSEPLADSEKAVVLDKANFSAFVLDLKENPLVLYFQTGSAYVNLSYSERETISRLNHYIDQNSDAKIMVHGHTDDSGSPTTNSRLAVERAEFLKSYLVRNGFRPNRIETVGHGEATPVAPNDTPEGRTKNRRVVLTIEN